MLTHSQRKVGKVAVGFPSTGAADRPKANRNAVARSLQGSHQRAISRRPAFGFAPVIQPFNHTFESFGDNSLPLSGCHVRSRPATAAVMRRPRRIPGLPRPQRTQREQERYQNKSRAKRAVSLSECTARGEHIRKENPLFFLKGNKETWLSESGTQSLI